MKSKYTSTLLFLFISILISGCCQKLNRFSVQDYQFEEQKIVGIKQSEKENIDIVFVHGMGGYAEGDPETAINKILKDMALSLVGEIFVYVKPNDSSIPKGFIHIKETINQSSKKYVNFYVFYWSPITRYYSTSLLYNDYIYNDKMASLNRLAKEFFVNDLISDVILYQNDKVGAEVRHIISKGMEELRNDSDIFFVTYSLGSKIVFDLFFEKFKSDNRDVVASHFINQTKAFYMLANQIPLLDLGPDNTFWRSLKTIQDRRGVLEDKHWLVAFSDVNDVLSYGLSTNVSKENQKTLREIFVNVLVTNEDCFYCLGSYGEIANPLTAHVGYGSNPQVLEIIIDGYQPATK